MTLPARPGPVRGPAATRLASTPMRIAIRLAQVALVVLLVATVVGAWRAMHDKVAAAPGTANTGVDLVLGPQGLGRLRLGMTEQEAKATGESDIRPGWQQNGSKCFSATVNEVTIWFASHHGLAVLSGPDRTRTPEGISGGATVAAVAAAYPALLHPEQGTAEDQVGLFGYVITPVPGNPAALYTFMFNLGGTSPATARLRLIMLSLRDQDEECTHAG
jgi:hypothetical protein